jgi:hypothetical protein
MSSTSNGSSAPRADHLDALVAELRVELADAHRELERRKATIAEAQQRVARITKAVDALDPPEPTEPRRPRGRPRAAQPGAMSRPVDENLDRVAAALVEHGEPTTIDGLYEAMGGKGCGIGRDTVRRGLAALRDDERVRIAGATDRGGTLWAPMPELLEAR